MLAIGLLLIGLSTGEDSAAAHGDSLRLDEIVIRDPFVLPVKESGTYYLYGTCPTFGQKPFLCYTSKDLKTWSGPHSVLKLPEGFWATQDYWAPEVHVWNGRYYMFATYAAESGKIRRTHIAVSDDPLGPFSPLGNEAQTPPGWMCLDGTFFVDEAGQPWMVFCHEWVQVRDGEICAIRLSSDLSTAMGDPVLLFKASSGGWVVDNPDKVTDGPFLYRSQTGKLLMLWSSFGRDGRYKVALARSLSDKLEGPWEQEPRPLFEDDGGHAMLFTTFEDKLMMAFHAPNAHPSRPRFLPVKDEGDTLSLVPKE